MTSKIFRRGVRVPAVQSIDFLELVNAGAVCSRAPIALHANDRLAEARSFLSSNAPGHAHQGFPVLDEHDQLIGAIDRRALLDSAHEPSSPISALIAGAAIVCFEDSTLREAADLMVRERVGRLPIVARTAPRKLLGILSRSDILGAHARRLDEAHSLATTFRGRAKQSPV
jgi:CIC family chloride channel protein